jgi:alpha-L-arabinofuranosidase
MKKLAYLIVFLLASGFEPITFSMLPSDNRITISIKDVKGKVNRNVFGTCLFSHKKDDNYPNQWSDYGGGVWNPVLKENPASITKIIKDLRIAFIKYQITSKDNWKNTVADNRTDYLFGLSEKIQTSETMGTDTSLVVNYHVTTPESAGDLVNFTKDKIKYFEIGNEIGGSRWGIKPEDYVERFLQYRAAMKAVDPTTQLGISLRRDTGRNWNDTCYTIKEDVDFGILHIYPTPYTSPSSGIIVDNYLHQQFYLIENYFKPLIIEVGEKLGKPLAITEFNGGWLIWKDRFYRYSLGNALVNAELIKVFLNNPNILFANNHELLTVGFGSVYNKFHDETDFNNPYILRPNYYMFKMYADYFGDEMIEPEVVCQVDDTVPILSVNASKDQNKVYLIIINKSINPVKTDIYLKDFIENGTANIYSLEGESPESHNEIEQNVKLINTSANLVNRVLNVTLQKHSITAVVISNH